MELLSVPVERSYRADVVSVGAFCHVLLVPEGGASSCLVLSLVFDPVARAYLVWEQGSRSSALVDTGIVGCTVATLAVDSTARMWVAYDTEDKTVEVKHSDFPYELWDAPPVTLINGLGGEYLCAVIAMPEGRLGVMWSDQQGDAQGHTSFGFRARLDVDDPGGVGRVGVGRFRAGCGG